MVRRILLGLVVLASGLAALLVWTPAALQQKAIQEIVQTATRGTPYDISLGDISGHWWSAITLHDVRLLVKETPSPLATAEVLELRLNWRALWNKRIQFTRITLLRPVIRLAVDDRGHPILPGGPSSSAPAASVAAFGVKTLSLREGRILVERERRPGVTLLAFDSVILDASVSSQALDIRTLGFHLGNGEAQGAGRIKWDPALMVRFDLKTRDFPLENLLRVAAAGTDWLHLAQTGRWTLERADGIWTASCDGTLERSPLALNLRMESQGAYQVDLKMEKVSVKKLWLATPLLNPGEVAFRLKASGREFTARALRGSLHARWTSSASKSPESATLNMDISGGAGGYRLAAATTLGSLTAHGRFKWDGKGWSSEAQFTGESLVWGDRKADRAAGSVLWDSRREGLVALELNAAGLQFQKEPGSWTVENSSLTLKGGNAQWDTAWTIDFINKLRVEGEGLLAHAPASDWRLAWQRLMARLPDGAVWQAEEAGSVVWRAERRVEIHRLHLTQGRQSIHAEGGFPDPTALHIEATHWDPAALNALAPVLTVQSGGAMNMKLDIGGRWPNWTGSGVFSAHVPEMDIHSIGLKIREIVAQAKITRDTIEIQKFTGKTPRGSIDISGRSRLPDLHFTLQAHDLPFSIDDRIRGAGDIELRLAGSLDSPQIDGKIALREGRYETPAKSKEKPKPAAVPQVSPADAWRRTVVNVGLRWDHNVWYRDGLTSIETRGDLRFQKPSGAAAVSLHGAITALQGTYAYYGRDFQIQSGQLQYLGPIDKSPLLTAHATYNSDSTTVYLDASGTLQQPALKLRSDPPLPDKDIVSVLVFGRPLSELSSRTGTESANQELAKMAGNVLGGYVLKGLRQSGMKELNLDVLNIQPSEQGSRLVVGRYLSRNLFLSYGQTFGATGEKAVTADYYLSRRWTLEASAGTAESQHLDLLFRFPLNKGGAPAAGGAPRQSPFKNILTQPLDLVPVP